MQASEAKRNAAIALYQKPDNVKRIMHYGTTSWSSIDGEWPSIILKLSSGQEYRLRSLFFAYEDREQITNLFIETCKRLSLILNAITNNLSSPITPAALWHKTDALMIDAVTTNLKIEDNIATALGITYKPMHLLCKSHTVEALDRSNLSVLYDIEKQVQQREILEGINPSLKSFFRGKKTTVEAGIEVLLSLISHDKSGKSSSLSDLFDHICEREGVVKSIFLYQQRRFAKLEKAAASLVEALPILRKVIAEADHTNILIESCSLYLSSELLITELQALAYFSYHVTFPFLLCMERSSQTELLKILPSLYNDLLLKKVDTLKAFQLDIRRINIKEPSELGLQIINDMCLFAAEAIKLQCGREYGFTDGEEQRATVLATEESEKLVGLPTNNLITERDFSKFGRLAKVAKSRNRKFTAKGIRDSMVLFKSDNVKVDRLTKEITKLLSHHERKWTKEQKQKLKERIQLKLAKGRKAKDYSKRLQQECKTWGGPFTSVSELQNSLKKHPDIEHRIVKTEMAYYAHSNKVEKIARPDLFRLNGISHDEKLENLALLLDEDVDSSVKSVVDLPTNEEVISKVYAKETKSNEISTHQINEMCHYLAKL